MNNMLQNKELEDLEKALKPKSKIQLFFVGLSVAVLSILFMSLIMFVFMKMFHQ